MTDRIEPALSAEYWAGVKGRETEALQIEMSDHWGHAEINSLPVLIALANAALPADDPRKITRQKIEALRIAASYGPDLFMPGTSGDVVANVVKEFADVLESYLPPE